MTELDRAQQIELVSGSIAEIIFRLHREAGVPLDLAIATAHAQAVTLMASAVGGAVAAERCRTVADQIEGIPGIAEATLLFAEPEGRA